MANCFRSLILVLGKVVEVAHAEAATTSLRAGRQQIFFPKAKK